MCSPHTKGAGDAHELEESGCTLLRRDISPRRGRHRLRRDCSRRRRRLAGHGPHGTRRRRHHDHAAGRSGSRLDRARLDPSVRTRGLDGDSPSGHQLESCRRADGSATVEIASLERGTAVIVQLHVREQSPPRTRVLRGATTAMLRPDLVVAALHAPQQTLSTRPVDVVADVAELNTDTGATATLTLMLGPTPLAVAKTVTVDAGSTKAVTFEGVKLETAMTAELTVRVENATPFETDATNNARSRTIEVTEHELVRSNVLVACARRLRRPVQQHVYAPVTNPPAAIAAGHGGEGEGARAPARPDLLQRRLRGAAAEPGAQPGVVHRHRPARPRGRCDDQHHLPGA